MEQAILIDLILAAVLVLCVWLGARRGFILTLCSLVAVIVALVGANLIADALAPRVAEAIEPKLEQVIVEHLDEALRNTEFVGVNGGVAASSEEIPLSGVLEVLRENELYQNFLDSVEKAVEEGAAATAASAAAQVASTIAGQLARGIIFSIAFLLVLVAWSLLSHALDLVSKLPVINSLNHTLGGALGAVKGLVILYVAAWVLCDLTGTIPPQSAEGTYILSFLLTHSPLELLGLA